MQGGCDLKALVERLCHSMRGKVNPQPLREEPLDKVQQTLADARRIHGL